MKVRIKGRIYEVPRSCPVDAPTKRILSNHLKTHGLESLLTSETLSRFAGCVDGIADREDVEIMVESESRKHQGQGKLLTGKIENPSTQP